MSRDPRDPWTLSFETSLQDGRRRGRSQRGHGRWRKRGCQTCNRGAKAYTVLRRPGPLGSAQRIESGSFQTLLARFPNIHLFASGSSRQQAAGSRQQEGKQRQQQPEIHAQHCQAQEGDAAPLKSHRRGLQWSAVVCAKDSSYGVPQLTPHVVQLGVHRGWSPDVGQTLASP